MKTPRGFSFAGVNVGIKQARKDVALFVSEAPCVAAGCFTVNKSRAAPVNDAAKRLPGSGFRAIVVNSGNANALTGPDGAEARPREAFGRVDHRRRAALVDREAAGGDARRLAHEERDVLARLLDADVHPREGESTRRFQGVLRCKASSPEVSS